MGFRKKRINKNKIRIAIMGIFNKLFNNKKKTFSQEEIDEAIEAMYRYKDKSSCIYTELRKVAKPDFTEFLIEKNKMLQTF
jgi:hypothetical protein